MPVLGGYRKQEQPRRLSGRFLVFIANKNQRTSSHYIYVTMVLTILKKKTNNCL